MIAARAGACAGDGGGYRHSPGLAPVRPWRRPRL